MYYSMIDLISLCGKLGIESTSMNRWGKEGLKAFIDFGATNAKRQWRQQRDFTAMGLSPSAVNAIQAAAQKHGLDRVVLFPCPVNGAIIPCFKMEGGDIAAFCQATGQPLLEKSAVNANETEQERLIHEYGIILYQR